MLRRVQRPEPLAGIPIGQARFPSPFQSGLEYASPARGTWNIAHTGMLIPEAHEIFICAAGCLRGVVLTAAELGASHRFSTVEVREKDLLEGTLEELAIEGVCSILERLPKKPPVVLVYTSCVHHFSGCDLDHIYAELRERYPEIDFVDCYMNPILRKSGLTPDQIMRSRLYQSLKPRPIRPGTAAIIGSDLPLDEDSDLAELLGGMKVHQIHNCETYGDYQKMAESAFYISRYPAARAGGAELEKRLGGRHLYVPYSYDYEEIENSLTALADALGLPAPDFAGKREACERDLEKTRELIGDTPIAIDYTFCPRPLGLAKLLLCVGMKVERVYLDVIIPEEKPAFDWLQANHPELLVYPTVHAAMRFHAPREPERVLAIGQKAAHFCNTPRFVNVVEGGGMLGYQAVRKTLELIRQAYLEEKPLKTLIQVKGMGCGGCI